MEKGAVLAKFYGKFQKKSFSLLTRPLGHSVSLHRNRFAKRIQSEQQQIQNRRIFKTQSDFGKNAAPLR